MAKVNVQEVFGKFAVEIGGKIVMFDTETEALAAGAREANSAEFVARADAYLETLGLLTEEKSKTAAGKRNQIVDFLAFEATLAVEAPVAE